MHRDETPTPPGPDRQCEHEWVPAEKIPSPCPGLVCTKCYASKAPTPPGAAAVTDAETRLRAEVAAAGKYAPAHADPEDLRLVLAELARLRHELTELTDAPEEKWDRKGAFEYHEGYLYARDVMGQQVAKILGGATAKEVQAWLKR